MRHILSLSILIAGITLPGMAQQAISDAGAQQVRDVLRMKGSFTRGQRKESSELIWAGKRARNESFGSIPDSAMRRLERSDGTVLVDMKVKAITPVVSLIEGVGGRVVSRHAEGQVRAAVPAISIDTVAESADVQWMRAADIGITNFVGAVTSQGYITHTANQSVALGFDGTGVRVGVLSDSASPARVAALIGSGDLPPDVFVVPGQVGTGSDEGTAMMEIVHDLAPGAKLFFATALGGQANFANNIRALRFTYHCDVIVDDFTYFAEGVFEDGTIAHAVNDVTADGAIYFSSAANSGNIDSGTGGTWEGDFQNGGDAGFFIDLVLGRSVPLHNFGTAGVPAPYDSLTGTGTNGIYLKWSDPLGASTNDYDLFVFDVTGTILKGFSIGAQTGVQDPVEGIGIGSNCGTSTASGYCPALGDRIIVVLYNGVQRALHLDTERGRLSIATQGATFGHNAGLNTVSMAATYWNSAHAGTVPFTGPDNPIETFSSDGPRRIFFNPDGTAITPGNLLFATNGGTVLQKPDITAADGVFTKTPGFLPFFGTSAAAPHAAAIAALVKSANPFLTNIQIKTIMLNSTVDNMAPGVDRDSGYGIVMALPAVQNALRP